MLIGRKSLFALAAMFGIGNLFQIPAEAFPALPPRFRARRRARKGSNTYTPNGKRECARRRRQIELGQLRASA